MQRRNDRQEATPEYDSVMLRNVIEAPVFAATLRDRIAQELRDRIVTAVLPNAAKLDIDQLAEEFGSSRTPVREALIQLSHEGLVDLAPRRGVHVKGMAPEEILDNFRVFAALSGIAAQWATEQADQEFVERLRVLKAVTDDASYGIELVQANWEFHREIHRACGSARLRGLIGQLSRTIPAGYVTVIPEQVDVSATEHDDLLEAIATGDSAEAKRVAEEHIRRAGLQLVGRLQAQADAETGA